MFTKFRLIDLGSEGEFTHTSTLKTKSRIDRICISAEIAHNFLNTKIAPTIAISDHLPSLVQLKITKNSPQDSF